MRKICVNLLYCIYFLSFSIGVSAQNIWQDRSSDQFNQQGERMITPDQFRAIQVNQENLKLILQTAPKEDQVNPIHSEALLNIPKPNGENEIFQIVEYKMMEDGLASRYPSIKTYHGVSTANPFTRIRLDWTERGFHAMVFDREGNYYIDPYSRANTEEYQSYYKKDYPKSLEEFSCGVEEEIIERERKEEGHSRAGDCTFRSYRLAMATTAEYSAFHGATSAAQSGLVLSEVITAMNRVNGIYEIDATVRMILIADTDQLFYYDAGSDPYTNNNGGTMLGQNISNINSVIGSANYDIGHVFSTGGGGVAYLRSVCGNNKAGGVTGLGSPTGDPFYVDYVAHEIGHQFGGNHTQNNSCQRASIASYEPGSASTIMGYAGICNPNVQNNSDDYFHGWSVQEIGNFVTTGAGNNCDTPISFTNAAPTVDAGDDYTIPASTPFVLTAIGNDGDNDPLEYCWEQWDNEVGSMPPSSSNTVGPMFRTFDPNPSPERYFPRLFEIINGNSPTWEVLPSVDRSMEFRCTVRDFNGTAGCNASDNMSVMVDATTGPFLVQNPNSNITWAAGGNETVNWDVAGTNGGDVNCSNVDIFLSYDGGFTYPESLASNVPNNGAATITVPPTLSTTARVMVKCADNIFFDISDVSFTITGQDFTLSAANNTGTSCAGADVSVDLNVGAVGGFNNPVNISASGLPPGASISFNQNGVTPPATITATFSNLTGIELGTYPINFQGTSTSGTKSLVFNLVIAEVPAATILTNPTDGQTDVSLVPLLEWNPVNTALNYDYEISTTSTFTSLIESGNTNGTSLSPSSALSPSVTYFWRVRAKNACGDGAWASAFSFETGSCLLSSSTDVPVNISASGQPTITSTITIPAGGTIDDVNVIGLNGIHTWLSDLRITLISPALTEVILFDRDCNNQDNFDISYDDQASTVAPCPPTGGGTHQPEEALAAFIGEDMMGTWTLRIQDFANNDGGTLQGWALNICFTPAPGCDTRVLNKSASGAGSLIDIIACANPGDTITFDPAVYSDTIQLMELNALINKNLYIIADPANNIFIEGTQVSNTFEIENGNNVLIEGVNIISGSAVEGRAILNSGNLTLRNVNVFRHLPPIAGGNKVKNLGNLTIEGNCNINN